MATAGHRSTGARSGKAMPVARGLPVLGSSIPLLRDPLTFLREQFASLGPVFDIRAPRRTFTVLAGTDANRFMSVEGRDCFESKSFWGRMSRQHECPHLLLTQDGPPHKILRGVYHDDLSRRVVAEQIDSLAELTRRELHECGQGGRPFSVRDFTRLLVSRQVHHLLTRGGAPIDTATVTAMMEQFRWDSNTLLLGKWPRVALRLPAYKRHVRTARRFLEQLISETAESMPDGWFGTTHRARQEHPELFTEGDVRMSFLLPFVAGVDTVGSTLAFALYEVLQDPALHQRVLAAVDGVFEDSPGEPSVAELRAIPELFGVVNETLRLYPAAFGLYRRTAREFEFAGHTLPAGRDVLVFTSAPHTEARYFADPYKFDIDRFSPPRNEHKQRYVFAPYGAGPHICLGAGMGEALLLVGVACLLRHGRLSLVDPNKRQPPVFDPSLAISGRVALRYSGSR